MGPASSTIPVNPVAARIERPRRGVTSATPALASVGAMKLRWLLLGLLVTLLLVPAGLLSAARLLDPPGGGWVRLVSFTPYAVVLYAAALLLLLLAWLCGRGFWRGVARTLAVVALVGAAVHAVWASGPYLGTSTAAAGTQHRLHVMTSNLLKGQASPSRVVEVAVTNDVDVLVLEEITPRALGQLQGAGLGQAYPHAAGKAGSGPAGTMVFSRYPLRHVKRLDTGFGSYGMDVRAPGGRVHLLAVHPRPPLGDAMDWRTDQGVVRHAARSSAGPTMIVGDLNATMDHVPMRALVGSGYADGATQSDARWQPTWPADGQVARFGLAVPSLLPIDHVFVNHGLRVLHTESVTVEGSDHRALVAVVSS